MAMMRRANLKELNPYLQDNSGSGYSDDAFPSTVGTSSILSSSLVGDGGASWRLKALRRAKEQAAREGRKLDDVVEERWGSLGNFAASVAAGRAAPDRAHLHAIKDRKRGLPDNSKPFAQGKESTKRVRHASGDHFGDTEKNCYFGMKIDHNIPSEYGLSHSRLGNKDDDAGKSSKEEAIDRRANDAVSSSLRNSSNMPSVDTSRLSADQLAAKVLQLRSNGRHEEAERLWKQVMGMFDKPNADYKEARSGTEPSTNRYFDKMSSRPKKREEDPDVHLAREIIHNRQYSLSDDDHEYFGGAPIRKHNRKREGMDEQKRNIPERILTQQERCHSCFKNPSRPKDFVVAIGNVTYLMLPKWRPVVEGQCCILPKEHESSTRTVNELVWEEIRNFKKCLLRMFAEQGKGVIFMETAIELSRQRRHCLIECVPVPRASVEQARMFFKKEIDEAEGEGGQHEMKKVIPTKGDLRRTIPAHLSYFHVEFGLDDGFVNVVDDDANFLKDFGLNVVSGVLGLPPFRRRQSRPTEETMQSVAYFARKWEHFDWTKDLWDL